MHHVLAGRIPGVVYGCTEKNVLPRGSDNLVYLKSYQAGPVARELLSKGNFDRSVVLPYGKWR